MDFQRIVNFELDRSALMAQYQRDISGLTCEANPVYGSPDYWIMQTYINGNTLPTAPSIFDLNAMALASIYRDVIEEMPE